MRIGYACVNTELNCSSSSAFRLKNYSNKRLHKTIKENINCLKRILEYNKEHRILFYRVTSKLVPFASHPVCKFNWASRFSNDLQSIGSFIKENNMRVSMHPDPYVVLNSERPEVVKHSVKELEYHALVLDTMKLSTSNKIVIHLGGVYGDKKKSLERFKKNYQALPEKISRRLVLENDEKSYSASDCLTTSLPIIIDSLHHELNNNNESLKQVINQASETWSQSDGPLILHYSEQRANGRPGAHSKTINLKHFKEFYNIIKDFNCDLMLEVKDKEQSVLRALKLFNEQTT